MKNRSRGRSLPTTRRAPIVPASQVQRGKSLPARKADAFTLEEIKAAKKLLKRHGKTEAKKLITEAAKAAS